MIKKSHNVFFVSTVPSVSFVFSVIFSFSVSLVSSQISRVSYLNGIILGNDVRLDFTISKGNSCTGYQILKSYDSTSFSVLLDYGGICGNSNTDESFNYTDAGVQKQTYLYYKILIPPFDYSKTLKIYVDPKKTKKNMLYTYPQPVDNIFTIYLDNENYADYTVKVIDGNGILKQETFVNAYKYLKVDITDYLRGVYAVLLIDTDGNFARAKVIKN